MEAAILLVCSNLIIWILLGLLVRERRKVLRLKLLLAEVHCRRLRLAYPPVTMRGTAGEFIESGEMVTIDFDGKFVPIRPMKRRPVFGTATESIPAGWELVFHPDTGKVSSGRRKAVPIPPPDYPPTEGR